MARRFRMQSLGAPERVRGWNALGRSLKLKSMGFTVATFPAGGGYDHPHSHATQEEVYLLLAGRGELAVDGKIVPMRPGDLVAVEPAARRALRSAPRSASTWLMVGAVPGSYREDDWTEYDEPSFPMRKAVAARINGVNGHHAAEPGRRGRGIPIPRRGATR